MTRMGDIWGIKRVIEIFIFIRIIVGNRILLELE
jgi:hypothetical protein